MADRPGSVALGTNVRTMRRARGITQEQLAQEVGITKSYVSRIEKGKRPVKPELLERLAEALDVEPDALDESTVLETRSTAWKIEWRNEYAQEWPGWSPDSRGYVYETPEGVADGLRISREAIPAHEWRAVRVETIETVEVW